MKDTRRRYKITGPTYLTILRIILSVPFAIFLSIPEKWTRITALVLFIIASLTDRIDGKWARDKKIVTTIGTFLDPLADKILVNLAFLILTYIGAIPLWFFAVILIRDFIVDGFRMASAREGITVPASIYGKLKTVSQMTALIIILLNLIINQQSLQILGSIVLYIALFLTVFSGTDYLIRGYKELIKPSK